VTGSLWPVALAMRQVVDHVENAERPNKELTLTRPSVTERRSVTPVSGGSLFPVLGGRRWHAIGSEMPAWGVGRQSRTCCGVHGRKFRTHSRRAATPCNKKVKLTSVEPIGRLQVISGVRLTREGGAMRSLSMATLLSTILTTVAVAGPPGELDSFSFLIGEWSASGSGEPGVGTGAAVFARALQGRAIVRTSFAEYPAARGRPASRHDDLMVIYAHAGVVHADYYDSEGHIIRYSGSSGGPGQAMFVSETTAGESAFRLSYSLEGGVLKGEFAIAPPGTAQAFTPYLTWESVESGLKK
jgi:hypothetical protein